MGQKIVGKFISYRLSKTNIERPKIAKDKHKMIWEDMKITLKIMKQNLKRFRCQTATNYQHLNPLKEICKHISFRY